MNAVGLIFADSYDVDLDELTEKRTLAAVSFGGRYRIIDFKLSNLVNAGVQNIGIITTQKYGSLMSHIRAGSVWDLDRKQSSLRFLPPFATEGAGYVYENRLEALQANLAYLRECREKYVIFGSCNYIGNMDYRKMMDFHKESGAYITGLYCKNPINRQEELPVTTFEVDDSGEITKCRMAQMIDQGANIASNTYIMEREELISILERAEVEGNRSFRKDVLTPCIGKKKVMAYEAKETLLFVDDLSRYLMSNMELLRPEVREELFKNPKRPIITRVKDSAPTRYGPEAVATNSLIADGAIIEGTVKNSIIFRGVHVKKGATVENSVVMQDTTIGENVHLNYAVLDKDVVIKSGRLLSGYVTHPFHARKGTVI